MSIKYQKCGRHCGPFQFLPFNKISVLLITYLNTNNLIQYCFETCTDAMKGRQVTLNYEGYCIISAFYLIYPEV